MFPIVDASALIIIMGQTMTWSVAIVNKQGPINKDQ